MTGAASTPARQCEASSLLEAALWYARKGFAVFPLTPGEKVPLKGSAGFKDATTDKDKITEWWQANPDANIGLATGAQTGVWVLDIDAHKDGGSTIDALEAKHGKLPDTVEVLTPHGGRHLWFAWPPNGTVCTSVGKIGVGVDIRGDGGYVVVPPSRLRDTTRRYDFEASSHLANTPIVNAPEWLTDRLCEDKPKATKADDGIIKQGTRNDTLARMAGAMRRQGMTSTEIESALKIVNNNRCTPPLSDKEVTRIAHSIGRYEPAVPTTEWPDATPEQRLAAERRERQAKRDHAEPVISRKEDTYGFKRLGDLLSEPEEDLEWIWEGHLLSGGTSILSGRPKAGKSTLVRVLALATARGEDFLGRPTTKGTVLYLGMEEKPSQVRAHFKSMGGNEDDEVYLYCQGAPQEPLIWLAASIAKYKPTLIIADTMQRLTRVKDANDYAGVANALEPVVDLARKTGAHLLLTHHTGRANGTGVDAPMGSTAIAGAFDTLLNLRRKGDMRTLASVQRYGADLEETVILKADNGCVMAAGSRKDHEEREAANAIVSFLEGNPGADQQQIRDGVEGHRTAVKLAALRRLVDGQVLDRKGKGKRGDPYLYSLSEKAGLLVPTIYREPENQKPNNGETTYFPSPDSGSRSFTDSSKTPDQREPETGTQNPPGETAPRTRESGELPPEGFDSDAPDPEIIEGELRETVQGRI